MEGKFSPCFLLRTIEAWKAALEIDSSYGGGSCLTFENGSSKPVDGTLGNTSGAAQSHGAGSCLTFENGSSKPVDGALGNTSGAVQSHGAGSSQKSGIAFSSLQAKNGVDFQETPSVEKSPGLSNNYTNEIENDDVIRSSKSTEAILDLSICAPAKVNDSKKAEQEVHGEPIIGSSLPSINGNLNPPILEVPNKDHDSELLHKKPENGNSNLTHQVNHCSSALNHTCLQKIPLKMAGRRPGDAAIVYGSTLKAEQELKWNNNPFPPEIRLLPLRSVAEG